jgi:uncharacterized protein
METVTPALRDFFTAHPRVALAFSGGTDSSYLLYAAKKCGAEITAYHVSSQFQPHFETEDARRLAYSLGVPLKILECDILSDTAVAANPPNRCYLCKRIVFSNILRAAEKDNTGIVIDATNASDDPSVRPGMKALDELGIVSPLRLCGIDKKEIRRLSKEAGLPTWDIPSNSCLATRIPAGTLLTAENLERTEKAEDELRLLGLREFRVRSAGTAARLEVVPEEKEKAESLRESIRRILLKYYSDVIFAERRR